MVADRCHADEWEHCGGADYRTVSLQYREFKATVALPLHIMHGQLFSICGKLTCQSAECRRVSDVEVSARMPAHNHGMATKPEISLVDDSFSAEGLMLQMPGEWQLYIDLAQGEWIERQRIGLASE
jgi:hypothetical protein